MLIFSAFFPDICRARRCRNGTKLKIEPVKTVALNFRPEQLQKIKPLLTSFFYSVRPKRDKS